MFRLGPCAHAQGRFWEFHDIVFENNRALSDQDLEKYAGEVGLDLDGFRTCIADAATQETVEVDVQAASNLGLSGTPAFLVNGIPLTGAKPFSEFVRVIDAELTRVGSAPGPQG